jgi:hypothetical protein
MGNADFGRVGKISRFSPLISIGDEVERRNLELVPCGRSEDNGSQTKLQAV